MYGRWWRRGDCRHCVSDHCRHCLSHHQSASGIAGIGQGWLAYSTFIDDQDRIHLARVEGSQHHQAFTELPGEVIRADFSPNGQLAFKNGPPDDVANVYVANADGTGARIVAECKFGECERGFPAWSRDGKYLATPDWSPDGSAIICTPTRPLTSTAAKASLSGGVPLVAVILGGRPPGSNPPASPACRPDHLASGRLADPSQRGVT